MANKLVFESAEDLKRKLEGFDLWLQENKYPYSTLERLCQYLGCCRQTLLNYQEELQKTVDKEEIEYIGLEITRAKRRLLADCVDRLYDRNTERGAEFQLKNNYGYSDKQDIDLNSSGTIRLAPEVAELSK